MKILIICTGNTCRSQMAEGFLRSFDPHLEVYSAGTIAEGKVNPYAVKVMQEAGIDISRQIPESVKNYLDKDFDYVITVCDGAKEVCPVFTGNVKHRIHLGFEDPANAKGTEEEVLPVYRKVRDQIKIEFSDLYKHLK
ncbi:MAG: arsenate reductase ArsC [Bacteroidales bacterium]|nr:arsenate reductase ArsC [Bacteroidales bacterium]MCF8405792.1 arsenate reductase ArsC [Bacteroidales bacterium]